MFRRSLIQASVLSFRSSKYIKPSLCVIPKSNFTSSGVKLNEKKQPTFSVTFENQLKLTDVKFKLGISPEVKRLLIPVFHHAQKKNLLETVRNELCQLTEIAKNPFESERFIEDIEERKYEFSVVITALLEQVFEDKLFADIPSITEHYIYLYRQVSKERAVQVLLPGVPTKEEVDILENELKAFYYKDPNIELDLKIQVNESIGTGRIYCFDEHVIDLTTSDIVTELNAPRESRKEQFRNTIDEFNAVLKTPLNSDLPAKNQLYQEGLQNYLQKIRVACGFAPST